MRYRLVSTFKMLAFLLGLGFAGVSIALQSSATPISARTPNPSPTIYASHCATCHGNDGRARTAKGKRLGATDFTGNWNRDEARGIRIITNGKDEMPSFKKKLSASEIRSVFSYVVQFRR